MIDLTVDKHSFAIDSLASEAHILASKLSPTKDIPKETLVNAVSKVLNDKLKVCDRTVDDINKKQFKDGEKVPINFFISLGFVDSRMLSILSQTLIEKLVSQQPA